MPNVKNIGKPCALVAHARFDEGGQARACSLLYPRLCIQKVLSQKKLDEDLSEIPMRQRRAIAKPLEYYLACTNNRDEAIALAYSSGGYGMKKIGDHFGLHYSTVSRIISGQESAKRKT